MDTTAKSAAPGLLKMDPGSVTFGRPGLLFDIRGMRALLAALDAASCVTSNSSSAARPVVSSTTSRRERG